MRKLAIAIMLGLGVMMSGCGTNQQIVPQQQQTAQQTEGISLAKAIALCDKGQFTPQKVNVEGYCIDKVWGDEPYITIHNTYNYNGATKVVDIQISDPQVIKNVAKQQEQQKKNLVEGYCNIDVHEIIINQYSIKVK